MTDGWLRINQDYADKGSVASRGMRRMVLPAHKVGQWSTVN